MATEKTHILNHIKSIDNKLSNISLSSEEINQLRFILEYNNLLKRIINRDASKMTIFDKANNSYRPQNISDLSFSNENGVIKLDCSSKSFSNYQNNVHSAINIASSDENNTPPLTFDFKYNNANLSRNTIIINNQVVELNIKLQNKILEIQNVPSELLDYFINNLSPELIAQ